MTNERNTLPGDRHLSIVPPIELTEQPRTEQKVFYSGEPEQPRTVTLRMDNRAINLLTALAAYDHTNPAEQIRAATTIYLNRRLGDKAVQDFITERDKQIQAVYDALAANKAQDNPDEEGGD